MRHHKADFPLYADDKQSYRKSSIKPPPPGGAYLDKTRQDDALFGVLYSPMYIDFIQII